jgi:hypothetical protein
MQALYSTVNNFAREESITFGADDEADTSHVALPAPPAPAPEGGGGRGDGPSGRRGEGCCEMSQLATSLFIRRANGQYHTSKASYLPAVYHTSKASYLPNTTTQFAFAFAMCYLYTIRTLFTADCPSLSRSCLWLLLLDTALVWRTCAVIWCMCQLHTLVSHSQVVASTSQACGSKRLFSVVQ